MADSQATRTIAFLSPYVSGIYFGNVLTGAIQAAQRHGVRLMVFQESAARLDRSRLAWDQIDGWIVVLDTTGIELIAQSGAPVVTISTPAPNTPVVRSDNLGGMYAAVLHLIEHGHRRIAFIGRRANLDIGQRYDGYCLALAEQDIPLDQGLVADAADELEPGGRDAARRLLDVGAPFTAIVAGTDKNALGVLEVLRAAGRRVPEDVALVGFDDVDEARIADPSLTTVRQRFDILGSAAIDLVLDRLAGRAVSGAAISLPTALVVRRSCGCDDLQLLHQHLPTETAAALDWRDALAWDLVRQVRYLDNIIRANNEISTALSGDADASALPLEWLRHSPATWGCLGLWTESAGQLVLTISSVYSRHGQLPLTVGERYASAAFLAAEALPVPAHGEPDIVMLLPVRTARRDWGVLALGGVFETHFTWSGDPIVIWAEMLSAALERGALLAELKEQQYTLQSAYERERALTDAVREIGSPVIPLMPGVLLVPLIGALDSRRARNVMTSALEHVRSEHATDLLIDVTGVPIIDTQVASALLQLARMVGLLGARTVLVGVRPEIAQSIVGLGIDLVDIRTSPTLAAAIRSLQRREKAPRG